MLPPLTVPAGLLEVLQVARGAFTAPGFATFTALVTGYLGATGRRTITGMWIAAGLSGRGSSRPGAPVLLPCQVVPGHGGAAAGQGGDRRVRSGRAAGYGGGR